MLSKLDYINIKYYFIFLFNENAQIKGNLLKDFYLSISYDSSINLRNVVDNKFMIRGLRNINVK